jgi:hypothetical protein
MAKKMKPSFTGWLIIMNAVGALAYLGVASRLWWIEPGLADIPGASGGAALIWFQVSVCFFTTFLALNYAALLRHLFVLIKKNGQRLSLSAPSTPAIWTLAVWIDYRHHGA